MSQEGKRLSVLETTLRQISGVVKKLNERIAKLNANLRQFGTNVTSFNKKAAGASKSIQQIGGAAKNTGENFEKSAKKSKGFFSTIGGNIKTITRFYGSFLLLQAGIKLLNEIFIASSKRAIAFEKALGDLAAVAGLTNEELSKVEKVALDVAGSTSLTTLEVVELQKALAKLGTNVEDIENLTRPIALLSQALGEEPGGVASSLKKALNVFGETSDQAAKFANVITGAVNESALSLQDLGTGLQYVGPIAKQSGLSFQETSALLGILADNGFKASRAGTGLRQFLITAAKDGRPFNEFLEDAASRTIGLTRGVEEFKKTGVSQALVILDNVDAFRELAGELENLDRLFYANAKQMGTNQGQLDLLASAYDNFSVRAGNYFLDLARSSDVLFDIIEKLDPDTAAQARAFDLISSASAETTEQVDLLAASLINFKDTEQEAGLSSQKTLINILESSGRVGEKTLEYYRKLDKEGVDLIGRLVEGNENGELSETGQDILSLMEGLMAISGERAKILRDERIAVEAAGPGYQSLLGTYNELEQAAQKGVLSEKQRLQLEKDVLAARTQTTQEYTDSVTVEERLIKSKRMKLYEDLLKQIRSVVNDEDAAREGAAKKDKKRVKEEIDLRKDALRDELDQLKTIRDAELLRAETIEDRAEQGAAIAAAQVGYAEAVSAANSNAASDIRDITYLTEESKKAIEDAAKSLEEIANISGSDGIGVFSNILTEFASSQAELDRLANQSVKDGGIGQKDYEQRVQSLRDVFKTQVEALISDLELEGAAAEAIREKTAEFLNAPYELKDESADDNRNALERLLGFDPTDAGEIEKYIQIIERALSEAADVYRAFNDVRIENLKSAADAELDIVKQRYDVEGDILKAQLENQLITETQYRRKQDELRRKQVKEENKINAAVFEQEKKSDVNIATLEGLEAIASSTINAFSTYKDPITASLVAAGMAAVIGTATAAKINAVNQRQFFPAKFEDGGMVYGPSHDQGGVPFSVQGRGGYEMEGGEFIINKRAAAIHRDLLETINNSYKSNATPAQFAFADGGLVNPVSKVAPTGSIRQNSEESVSYLRAIAEASTATAINSNKPVRAFVTSSDLRSDDSARRIKDSNTTI